MSCEEYETEWVRDYKWTTDPQLLDGHVCSQRHCERPAAARFLTPVGVNRVRRQFCCDLPSHLYGRRIVDGEIQIEVAVGSPFWKQAKEMESHP